jgi:hypothetical protein
MGAGCESPSYTEEELCDIVGEQERGAPKTVALLCNIEGYGEDMSECDPGARGRWASEEALHEMGVYCKYNGLHASSLVYLGGLCPADTGTSYEKFAGDCFEGE